MFGQLLRLRDIVGHICINGESGIISGDNCVGVGTILVSSDEGDMREYIDGLERLKK